MHPSHVLTIKCPDREGIVAAVAGYLAANDASIVESHHFNDVIENRFFMRTVFRSDSDMPPVETLRANFAPTAKAFDMSWELHDGSKRLRMLVAVSRFGHCLFDLLHRWRTGLLPVDLVGVLSNHEDMRSFVEWNSIPFHHLAVETATRSAQEARIASLVDETGTDLVVLARYMQILSPELARHLSGRCINIHHSFLPSFKGAKPYHQAHGRGVKIIGATAHYVTSDLDEGPIIEQDVRRVHHGQTPDELVALGRDIECSVLARAVTWHAERRVLLNGDKTIVFA